MIAPGGAIHVIERSCTVLALLNHLFFGNPCRHNLTLKVQGQEAKWQATQNPITLEYPLTSDQSANLYSFSEETGSKLRKFRFASARSDTVQAVIYEIDKQSHEILEDAKAESPCTSIEELVEELPDNTPRYVVLSYPLTLKDGRKSSPLVMLYWLPPTAQQSHRMLYAAAVELFREKAGVSKYVSVLTLVRLKD